MNAFLLYLIYPPSVVRRKREVLFFWPFLLTLKTDYGVQIDEKDNQLTSAHGFHLYFGFRTLWRSLRLLVTRRAYHTQIAVVYQVGFRAQFDTHVSGTTRAQKTEHDCFCWDVARQMANATVRVPLLSSMLSDRLSASREQLLGITPEYDTSEVCLR